MLVYGIKLSIYVIFSLLAASLVERKIFFSQLGKKILLVWICVLPFVLIIQNELLNVLVCLGLLFYLNQKNSHIASVVLFIATLGAMPDWSKYLVSVPGINELTILYYWKVALIVLLLPLFLKLKSISNISWNLTDSLLCIFVAYITILSFREYNITTVIRFFLDSIMVYIIPYFVISRVVKSLHDLNHCALAFLVLAVLLAAVYCVSQIVQFDIYNNLDPNGHYLYLREYRMGFLRLSGPFNGVLVGFLMLAGFLALEILKPYYIKKKLFYWALLIVFIFAIIFGGSRGALFGFILGVGIYFYFARLTGSLRVVVGGLIVVLLILELAFGVSAIFIYEDEYGTFDYRGEVYKTSWEYMKLNPLFGTPYFIESGYFDHLITGLGIIDIVSAYLPIGLRYGFIGLFLYVGIFLSVLVPLVKRLLASNNLKGEYSKHVAMYVALIIAMLFIITTTSLITLFPLFITILWAIGRALSVKSQF